MSGVYEVERMQHLANFDKQVQIRIIALQCATNGQFHYSMWEDFHAILKHFENYINGEPTI